MDYMNSWDPLMQRSYVHFKILLRALPVLPSSGTSATVYGTASFFRQLYPSLIHTKK